MRSIEKMTALITGGSKGIGYGVAASLVAQNIDVAITSSSQDNVDKAVAALKNIGKGDVIGIVADVRSLESQKKAVDAVISKFGKLDLLVANAGVGYFGLVEDITEEQWRHMVDVNLTGVFNSVKASVEALKKSKGYIVTIASLAGTNFFERGSGYIATKFGLVGFTQAIMLDLRSEGVKVSTILPGAVSTDFFNNASAAADSWKMRPEDIGAVIVNILQMDPRALPSKIELRTSSPPRNITLRSDPPAASFV